MENIKNYNPNGYQSGFADLNRDYYNSKKNADAEEMDIADDSIDDSLANLSPDDINNLNNLEDGHYLSINGTVYYKADGEIYSFDSKDMFYYEGNGKYFAVTKTNSNGEVVGMLQMDPDTGEIKGVSRDNWWVASGDENKFLMTANGEMIYNVDGQLRYATTENVKTNTDGTTLVYDKNIGKVLVFDDNNGSLIAQSTLIDNPHDNSNTVYNPDSNNESTKFNDNSSGTGNTDTKDVDYEWGYVPKEDAFGNKYNANYVGNNNLGESAFNVATGGEISNSSARNNISDSLSNNK